MDKKLSDPWNWLELDIINRYRLERFANRYGIDEVIEDEEESITFTLKPFTIPLVVEEAEKYAVGRVWLSDDIGKYGFRLLKFEYVEGR